MVLLDIDKPSKCMDCPLLYDMMCCIVTGSSIWRPNMTEDILNDCPIHDIKEGDHHD